MHLGCGESGHPHLMGCYLILNIGVSLSPLTTSNTLPLLLSPLCLSLSSYYIKYITTTPITIMSLSLSPLTTSNTLPPLLSPLCLSLSLLLLHQIHYHHSYHHYVSLSLSSYYIKYITTTPITIMSLSLSPLTTSNTLPPLLSPLCLSLSLLLLHQIHYHHSYHHYVSLSLSSYYIKYITTTPITIMSLSLLLLHHHHYHHSYHHYVLIKTLILFSPYAKIPTQYY